MVKKTWEDSLALNDPNGQVIDEVENSLGFTAYLKVYLILVLSMVNGFLGGLFASFIMKIIKFLTDDKKNANPVYECITIYTLGVL